MIALFLALLLLTAAAAAYAVTVWPVAATCGALVLGGSVVLVMAAQIAQTGAPGLAALLAAGGVAAQLAGVLALLSETGDRAAPAW